jgi:hypothetical protein
VWRMGEVGETEKGRKRRGLVRSRSNARKEGTVGYQPMQSEGRMSRVCCHAGSCAL